MEDFIPSLRTICPGCDQMIETPTNMMDERINCPHCAGPVQVGAIFYREKKPPLPKTYPQGGGYLFDRADVEKILCWGFILVAVIASAFIGSTEQNEAWLGCVAFAIFVLGLATLYPRALIVLGVLVLFAAASRGLLIFAVAGGFMALLGAMLTMFKITAQK